MKYADYENMINKLAWDWNKKTGLDFDELQAEGNLVFCDVIGKFDPAIGIFGTFLYRCLVNRFISLYTESCNVVEGTEKLKQLNYLDKAYDYTMRRLCLDDLVSRLSKEAEMMVDMALNPRGYFTKVGLTPKRMKGQIKEKMKQEGFTNRKIDTAIQDIRLMLNEIGG